jgi:hypothetical protein
MYTELRSRNARHGTKEQSTNQMEKIKTIENIDEGYFLRSQKRKQEDLLPYSFQQLSSSCIVKKKGYCNGFIRKISFEIKLAGRMDQHLRCHPHHFIDRIQCTESRELLILAHLILLYQVSKEIC